MKREHDYQTESAGLVSALRDAVSDHDGKAAARYTDQIKELLEEGAARAPESAAGTKKEGL